MHETYMLPFAEAVREGSASIMCSYNKINETAVCQNSVVIDLVKNVRISRTGSNNTLLTDCPSAGTQLPRVHHQ